MLGLRPQLKSRPSLLDLVSKTANPTASRPSTPFPSELDEDDERPPPYEVPLPESPQYTRSRQPINSLSSPADANPPAELNMPPVSIATHNIDGAVADAVSNRSRTSARSRKPAKTSMV